MSNKLKISNIEMRNVFLLTYQPKWAGAMNSVLKISSRHINTVRFTSLVSSVSVYWTSPLCWITCIILTISEFGQVLEPTSWSLPEMGGEEACSHRTDRAVATEMQKENIIKWCIHKHKYIMMWCTQRSAVQWLLSRWSLFCRSQLFTEGS